MIASKIVVFDKHKSTGFVLKKNLQHHFLVEVYSRKENVPTLSSGDYDAAFITYEYFDNIIELIGMLAKTNTIYIGHNAKDSSKLSKELHTYYLENNVENLKIILIDLEIKRTDLIELFCKKNITEHKNVSVFVRKETGEIVDN